MAQAHMTAAQVVQQPTQPYLRDPRQMNITQNGHEILVRYIIDYCDKRGYKDTCAHLRRESKINDPQRPPVDSPEGLLYEWWTCFWEIYTARVRPEKSANRFAKEYAQKLPQLQMLAAQDQGSMGPGPSPRPLGPPRPYMNGTGPHPAAVNGHGPPFPGAMTSINGVAPTANMAGVSGANPTPLQNPSLQHLGPPRPGQQRPFAGPGNPGMPQGMQFAHPGQTRMLPNTGPHPPHPPNARTGPGAQSSSPQMADSQMAGASSSPQQSNSTNLADIPPPQLQEYLQRIGHPMTNDANALPEHVKLQIRELHEQSGRGKNPRGIKRGSPGGEESLPKGDSPSERKKARLSSQEPGNNLPSTPSITPVQPPMGPRPPPSNMGPPKGSIPPHPQALHPSGHPLGVPPYPEGLQTNMAGQMAQLVQAQSQRLQSAPPVSQQSHHQYFASLQQQTFTGYKPTPNPNGSMPPSIPNASQPLNADPAAQFGRPGVGGTNPPKGAMLPPPPPNNASVPSPAAGGQVPSAKGTPIMSSAVPRGLGGIKDENSPSGVGGFSPEMARPASRPNPGSTPQAVPSAPTPSASATGPPPTTGAPSAMSAPSPSQLATPQQTSRPQSQSPSATATARPSTATLNGTPSVTSTPNQSAMLARTYPGVPSGPGTMLGGPSTNPSLAPGLLGGPSSVTPSTMDSNSTDLFGMGLGASFSGLDMQMMGFHEDSFANLDFGLSMGAGEDPYAMNMFINDPADSVTG